MQKLEQVKKCKKCNKEYLVKQQRNQFCSRFCSNKSRTKLNSYNCILCNKELKRRVWQVRKNKRIFCSPECYKTYRPKVTKYCNTCNNKLQIYRSRASYYNNFYCNNKCRLTDITQKLTQLPIQQNKYHKFIRSLRCTAIYLRWKQTCLQRDNLECKVCKRKSQLTVHHIFTMAQFVKKHGMNRKNIEIDPIFIDTSNGITLCRSCHLKEHLDKKDE